MSYHERLGFGILIVALFYGAVITIALWMNKKSRTKG